MRSINSFPKNKQLVMTEVTGVKVRVPRGLLPSKRGHSRRIFLRDASGKLIFELIFPGVKKEDIGSLISATVRLKQRLGEETYRIAIITKVPSGGSVQQPRMFFSAKKGIMVLP